MKPLEQQLFPLATDGFHLLYEPRALLKGYREQQSFVLRGYLHALLHCLFRHMFVSTAPMYWAVGAIETVTFVPMLGAGGSYLSFVTGNISNLKLPCVCAIKRAKRKK